MVIIVLVQSVRMARLDLVAGLVLEPDTCASGSTASTGTSLLQAALLVVLPACYSSTTSSATGWCSAVQLLHHTAGWTSCTFAHCL